MFKTLIQHRQLLLELVKREFTGRYRGSFGGVLWSMLEPLLMFTVYVVAFGYIMQLRWNQAGDVREYAFMMFAGMIVFQAFSECLNKAPRLIVSNPNFVKKVVFPLEILPWVMIISILAHLMIAVLLWILFYIMLIGIPHHTVLYVPIVLLAFCPLLLALGLILAALGVVVRDIDQVTGMLARALLFMTPIFYNSDSAPPLIKGALMVNPLTFIIEQLRLIMFIGHAPSFIGLLIYFLFAAIACVGSLFIFRCLRPIFADNL